MPGAALADGLRKSVGVSAAARLGQRPRLAPVFFPASLSLGCGASRIPFVN